MSDQQIIRKKGGMVKLNGQTNKPYSNYPLANAKEYRLPPMLLGERKIKEWGLKKTVLVPPGLMIINEDYLPI